MRLHEVAKNDKKLAEWDANVVGWGLDALSSLVKKKRKGKSRMKEPGMTKVAHPNDNKPWYKKLF